MPTLWELRPWSNMRGYKVPGGLELHLRRSAIARPCPELGPVARAPAHWARVDSGPVSGACFVGACSPWSAPFPPPPPPQVTPPCSVVSSVLWSCPTSHARASPDCGRRPSRRGLLVHLHEADMGSPGSRASSVHTCWRSSTAQGHVCTRLGVHPRVAFRTARRRRHPGCAWFRGSILCPCVPLSTLHPHPCECAGT